MNNQLIFFNKEGDALNLNYDTTTGVYNGTLNFDENSSDTFKTIGLYLFEKVPSITFDAVDSDTKLEKFQLFNENRFTFTGNSYFTQSISKIESVNNNSSFYSKWVYGENFETKFPIGSSIVFNQSVFEFTNPLITYTIVSSKKDAVMIISSISNSSFSSLYGGLTFSNKTISGLNTIGVYDYKRGLVNQMSSWNEPTYYSNIYNDKKLTIVNGQHGTQSVITVENKNLVDRTYYRYDIDQLMYTQSNNLSVLLTLKSDLPNIYTGPLDIIGNLVYLTNPIPKILLPGTQFVINNSTLNISPITIATIPIFSGNINTIYYATQSQVMWNNIIYECVTAYTQSPTSSISPDNTEYWTNSITYLPSATILTNEIILDATLHLTTNKFIFTQAYTYSNEVTMAYFAQNNKSNFDLFNIDLSYLSGTLSSSLKYASNYVDVNYQIGSQSNLEIKENIFQTKEILNNSINKNISSNFGYTIVVTDIDSYGITFILNDQKYIQSVDFVYNGLNVDLEKSIDSTLRIFLFDNYNVLRLIGVNISLESSIGGSYMDTIIFETEYPNVPLKLAVLMGTTANFYVKHSSINFFDMGNYLNIHINGKDYGQIVTSSSQSVFIPDIPTTITNWVNKYYQTLFGYGIFVSNISNILYFNINEPTKSLKYSIRIAKLAIPGMNQYAITNYINGNFGTLIAGNQITLSATSSQDLEVAGFSTGMITSVNNTIYPYDNQEYNILYLNSSKLGLSYQGPFWETSIAATISTATYSTIGGSLFGSLSSTYVPNKNIWLKTRQYIRGPRANYTDDNTAQIVYKFLDDQTPQIFMYDESGSQLPVGTSYSYVGDKPLPYPYLNDKPNMDITKIDDSSVQQTIFSEIIYSLDYIDSNTNISILPTPIELFLGYNDIEEGYVKTTLKAYYRENVSYEIIYNSIYRNSVTLMDMGVSKGHPSGYGIIQMDKMSSKSFTFDDNGNKTGLKAGQLIQIFIKDVTNSNNKYISENNGNIFLVYQVYNTQLVVEYIDNPLVDEITVIEDFPTTGLETNLKMTFNVLDKEFLSIDLYGQSEIEDIRYKIELYNSGGHNIDPQDSYIFKTYDINEEGIDWTFLNKKRKEMLMVRSDIFPYVGSYKAIINSINYFGYNDLELYEYYRNININSPNFYKLFKIEIPDIFDNTVSGFTIDDFLKHTMPNPNFEETNMFNLTYKITDKQGNNVLLYSLREVIVKLQGLKNWLESNVVPITHKILDITGRTDFVGGSFIKHKSFSMTGIKTSETMTPVDFNINEAYLMPVNSGSTVYNVVLDFVSSKKGILPNNFEVVIKTYKTYLEWNPFTTYNLGDEVIYYGIIYKSFVDSNKLLDPRKYSTIELWDYNTEYFDGQFANYNRHIYEYLGTQSSFIAFGTASVPTPATTDKWLDVSEWIIQDLVPVQTINEHRMIDSVTYSTANVLFYTTNSAPDYLTISPSFNFSIDSNIDPFITVEINSFNGYGLNYTSRKNYEIRGSNDLYTGQTYIEPIGPFIPITTII